MTISDEEIRGSIKHIVKCIDDIYGLLQDKLDEIMAVVKATSITEMELIHNIDANKSERQINRNVEGL